MRSLLKNGIYFAFIIVTLPVALSFHLLRIVFNEDQLTAGYSQFLSLFPGQIGNYIRKASYRFILPECDSECVIGFGTLFSHKDTHIGKSVYIGPQGNIGKCRIEDHCLLGSGVHILSGKNQHNIDELDTPLKDQGGHFEKINIGSNTWVGNGAIIMANVGQNCVVAAGAVVTQDVEDYSIVGGNPAKLIKKRN